LRRSLRFPSAKEPPPESITYEPVCRSRRILVLAAKNADARGHQASRTGWGTLFLLVRSRCGAGPFVATLGPHPPRPTVPAQSHQEVDNLSLPSCSSAPLAPFQNGCWTWAEYVRPTFSLHQERILTIFKPTSPCTPERLNNTFTCNGCSIPGTGCSEQGNVLLAGLARKKKKKKKIQPA